MELKEAVGEKMELQEEYLLVQQVTKQMDEELDKYMKDRMDEAVENLGGRRRGQEGGQGWCCSSEGQQII